MELPKYKTQIGMPSGSHKIFIEDYVISYIKQVGKEVPEKKIKIALFGIEKRNEDMKYFFVYGAVCLEWPYGRDDYFSEQEIEEAENKKRNYFDEYPLIGWCCIENELQEGLYILQNKHGMYIEGFHIFYERNEGMLAYLTHRHVEKKEETVVKEEPVAAYRQLVKTKPVVKKTSSWNKMKTAVLSAFLLVSAIAILVMNGSIKLSDFQNAIGKAILTMNEKKIPDRELVTDDSLINELQKENTPMEATIETPIEAPMEAPVEEAMGQTIESEEPVEHIIAKGETLISISKKYYGDESKVSLICEKNNIQDADNIQIGQKIILP